MAGIPANYANMTANLAVILAQNTETMNINDQE
jgi:hypothetical protein